MGRGPGRRRQRKIIPHPKEFSHLDLKTTSALQTELRLANLELENALNNNLKRREKLTRAKIEYTEELLKKE